MTYAVAGVPIRSHVLMGLAAVLAFVVLFAWSWDLPLLVAVLVAGAFVGMCASGQRAAVITGAFVGLAGSAISVALHTGGVAHGLVSAGASTALGGMPSLYALLIRLGEHGPAAVVASMGAVPTLAVGTVATAVVAGATARAIGGTEKGARARRVIALALVAVVCLSYANTAWNVSGPVVDNADREPSRGQYAYDSIVYLKTYYLMLAGQDYYSALRDAAAGDERIIEDGSIRDGKYQEPTWMWGPSAMRRPTIFYVWKHLAPRGGGGVVALAVMASTLSLASLAWGLTPYLAHRAALLPALAMPYVLFMTLGRNVFFPDYWGALLSMLALTLVMRHQWIGAAAVLLASAAVRETAGPTLAVVGATLLVVWLRQDRGHEWLVRAGAFAAATALWLGFERLHEALGARYIAFEYPSTSEILLETATSRTLERKIVVPTDYLLPGGFFPLRGTVLMLLALAGFRAVLASERAVRLTVVTYMGFWVVFLLVIGATSEYWGQTIVFPSVVGAVCLLLAADRLDLGGEMRTPLDWD